MRIRPTQVSLIALSLAGTPVMAQETPGAAGDAPETAQATEGESAEPATTPTLDEIVVIARRVAGQVQTTSPPIVELNEADVAAYGASSIADLVAQLSPQVGSGRGRGGRPVFLLNGQRISSFRELGRLPPEAIKKVEVLPEEVALKFGYPAEQRVINFILKDNFASREVEAEYGMPTAGGYGVGQIEGSLVTIAGTKRLNASVEYRNTTPLTEAERGIVQTPGSVPTVPGDADPAAYRSLVSRNSALEANITRSASLNADGSAGSYTLNGQVLHDVTRSLSGLDTVRLTGPTGASALRTLGTDPIERRTVSDTYSFGSALNKPLGDWQLTATLDAARGISRSRLDRRADTSPLVGAAAAGTLPITGPLPVLSPAGRDEATTKTYTVDTLATLNGQPLLLPGGQTSLTLSAGYKLNGIDSSDTRSMADVSLDRRRATAGVTLGVPITSRREDFGAAIGDLSLNLAGGVEHLSDFGTLYNYTTGLVWKPTERLGLQATYVANDAAPSLTQLGAARIVNFNVPTYDFRTGQTVLITTTSGGNPDLVAEKQRDLKLSASYDLDLLERANVLVEYYRNRSSNVTSNFPLLTTDVEAAFPGRVTRATDGTLLAIDARPVTFASTASSRLRYGFNLFGKVGKPKPQAERAGGGNGVSGGGGRTPQETPAPAAPTTGAPGAGGGTTTTMTFDPARFAEMRTKFCATPEGQVPDLTGVPDRMLERLRDENGNVDPAKVAALKTRLCAADGTPGAPGGEGGARRFDPQRFAALRTALDCANPDTTPGTEGIPQEVLDRLKSPDGTVDPARLKEFKTRICALPAPAPAAGQQGQGGEGGGRRGGGGEGGGMMRFGPGGGGDGQGRWSLSLYHTVNLQNRVTIAPGGPVLDLLNGDATGNGGGISRHQVELEGGLFKDGIGARLSGNYASGTRVFGSGLPGSSDLRFGDLATFNLRLFVALDQQKWLTGIDNDAGLWKGARLSLRVNNLFDTRQRVTDQNGVVPLRYQPGLIDPTGRFVEVEFRKVF